MVFDYCFKMFSPNTPLILTRDKSILTNFLIEETSNNVYTVSCLEDIMLWPCDKYFAQTGYTALIPPGKLLLVTESTSMPDNIIISRPSVFISENTAQVDINFRLRNIHCDGQRTFVNAKTPIAQMILVKIAEQHRAR